MDKYNVSIYKEGMEKPILKKGISLTNDVKILSCAYDLNNGPFISSDITFFTNDLCLKHIARLFFDKVKSIEEEKDDYLGYKDITMSNDDMTYFYSNPEENIYNLLQNEYLIVRNNEGEIVDRLCWTGENYRHLDYATFSSKWFGNVKPMANDVY
mgnify:FL=1